MAMIAMKTSVTHNKALMTTVRGYRAFSNLMLVFVTQLFATANSPVKQKLPTDGDVDTSPAKELVGHDAGLLPLIPQFLALDKNDS